MTTRQPVMKEKPDGRLYARVTRRCVAILRHLRSGDSFELGKMADEIRKSKYLEFEIRRNGELIQTGSGRIADYLSYVHALGLIVRADRLYSLNFTKPRTDSHWAQSLSDAAREHLAKEIGIKPTDLPDKLEEIRTGLHKQRKVPTLSAVLASVGIEGARKEEFFRWSLHVYADGEACLFELRQFPHLARKPSEGG